MAFIRECVCSEVDYSRLKMMLGRHRNVHTSKRREDVRQTNLVLQFQSCTTTEVRHPIVLRCNDIKVYRSFAIFQYSPT